MLKFIRKFIGVFFSFIGLFLLAILTFGNIIDIFTSQYWENVYENILSIGLFTIALLFVQQIIKQGVCEQALSKGLSSPRTDEKYAEHKAKIRQCAEKQIYLSYFLDMYNSRDTKNRKRTFLIHNKFSSEQKLYFSKNKRLIKKYNKISTELRLKDIKWCSSKTIIDKKGRIETLAKFRQKRAIKGILSGAVVMLFTTFIARDIFESVDNVALWAKFIKFATYIVTIFATVLMGVPQNYEKGAFGVPDTLEELNKIWDEFEAWPVPQYALDEVEENSGMNDFYLTNKKDAEPQKNTIEKIGENAYV